MSRYNATRHQRKGDRTGLVGVTSLGIPQISRPEVPKAGSHVRQRGRRESKLAPRENQEDTNNIGFRVMAYDHACFSGSPSTEAATKRPQDAGLPVFSSSENKNGGEHQIVVEVEPVAAHSMARSALAKPNRNRPDGKRVTEHWRVSWYLWTLLRYLFLHAVWYILVVQNGIPQPHPPIQSPSCVI